MSLPKSITVTFLVSISAVACHAQAPDRAAELFSKGDYAAALQLMEDRLNRHPEDLGNRFMVAQTMFLLGDYEGALKHWLEVERGTNGTDLIVKEKLIQAFEATDKPQEVALRVDALLRLHKETDDADYRQKKLFCRDQFTKNGVKFMGFQYFGFPEDGDTQFVIFRLDDKGEIAARFKFWSNELTNVAAKASGSIKGDQRLYHIDEYVKGAQRNLLHTVKQLSYREFKKAILEELTTKK
jgi:hypothetical protein